MEIKEIEYIYYGEKCSSLEKIIEQLELKHLSFNEESIIFLETKLNSVNDIESEEAVITPLVKVNGEKIDAIGEISCKECSDKYGIEVRHKVYNEQKNDTKVTCNTKMEQKDIMKILEHKICNCGCSCGGCGKH